MDSSSESVLVSKVPMLKPNEFDMWKIRIKQYILLTDFSMWDIIENGPSDGGKMDADGKRPPPKTDGERKMRQTEMKTLSTLLLAIPNEYQHQFCNCFDAQILWNALEKRFSGTKSTKRNQKAILKQQYENFLSTKNESMTQTFDRFNKLIGELATVGVLIDQDYVNRKFLRSLGEEWTMNLVCKTQESTNDQLEDKELDDLYNDLRVFEAEVDAKKRPSGYSYNAALLSSSTDSAANSKSVSAAYGSKQDGSNDSVLEAFLASHANFTLINDDLEQINADDLEEMDIKWQMAVLTMRVKRFVKRTGRNNFAQKREDGVGFDKSKVECYKCHKLGHFARECRSGMPQQHTSNHQPSQSTSFNNRNSSQALVSQEGMGFDWSDQAEEAVQNQALMAKVSELASTDIPTEVTSNLCSKTCIETVKKYRDHNQSMCDDLKRLERDRREYVLIVERFEEQIKSYQANELQHSYDTNNWKWEKNQLETELEKAKTESEKIKSEFEKAKLDIEKYSNASKAMDSLLKTQVHDKLRRGIGYNTTPPPYNNNYIPPTSDLLEKQDKKELTEGATEVDPLDKVVVEADSEEEDSESKNEKDHKVIPLENHILTNERGGKPFVKSEKVKSEEETVKNEKAETSKRGKGKVQGVHYMQTTVVNPCTCKQNQPQQHDKTRGNQRNRNNQWALKQGIDLRKINTPKSCFICGKLNHLAKHCYFNPINQRITFQRNIQNLVGYRKQIRNHMAENVRRAPIKSHAQNKFANSKKNTPNKPRSNLKKKKANNFVQVWVPKVKKSVSTATANSTADKNNAAASNTTANPVSTANKVSTANPISTANDVSVANKVSTANQVSTATSDRPIILTKYSSNKIPQFDNLIKSEYEYVDKNGKPKTTLAWVPIKN
ncbi:hypothetical protein L6452_32226 [Arctium lappa]|uniref:Uncharacterized protein n=1 Tax=Arctium lappa TaxID=4217 RepID=A0ACB8Z4V5_ARCLA|nr:hypothetical protein L6452_32226 [Arctium lappa]